MAIIMDGKAVGSELLKQVQYRVGYPNPRPRMAILMVGNNPASEKYVALKRKDAEYCRIGCSVIRYDDQTDTDALINDIQMFNDSNDIHGIMVQLPMTAGIDMMRVLKAIDPRKDIDGLSPISAGLLSHGYVDGFVPATPLAIDALIKKYNISVQGANVTIVSRSNLIGKPLASLMINEGATVTVCNSRTPDIHKLTGTADIVVLAAGKKNLFTADYFAPGSTVIEVSTNIGDDGKIVGDIVPESYDDLMDKCNYICKPVGGVGPVTRAMLLWNLTVAYNQQRK